MQPLNENEVHLLNYAVKHGYLDENEAEGMLANPALAREYIAKCDAQN